MAAACPKGWRCNAGRDTATSTGTSPAPLRPLKLYKAGLPRSVEPSAFMGMPAAAIAPDQAAWGPQGGGAQRRGWLITRSVLRGVANRTPLVLHSPVRLPSSPLRGRARLSGPQLATATAAQ